MRSSMRWWMQVPGAFRRTEPVDSCSLLSSAGWTLRGSWLALCALPVCAIARNDTDTHNAVNFDAYCPCCAWLPVYNCCTALDACPEQHRTGTAAIQTVSVPVQGCKIGAARDSSLSNHIRSACHTQGLLLSRPDSLITHMLTWSLAHSRLAKPRLRFFMAANEPAMVSRMRSPAAAALALAAAVLAPSLRGTSV